MKRSLFFSIILVSFFCLLEKESKCQSEISIAKTKGTIQTCDSNLESHSLRVIDTIININSNYPSEAKTLRIQGKSYYYIDMPRPDSKLSKCIQHVLLDFSIVYKSNPNTEIVIQCQCNSGTEESSQLCWDKINCVANFLVDKLFVDRDNIKFDTSFNLKSPMNMNRIYLLLCKKD